MNGDTGHHKMRHGCSYHSMNVRDNVFTYHISLHVVLRLRNEQDVITYTLIQIRRFSVVQQPKSPLGRLMLRFLDQTSLQGPRTSDQLVAEAATYITNTKDEHPCP
jgi:hypothetical protein